ncbi:uncharacterized protein TrAFT101_008904 [Trichoderma asperellum]|uniref:Transcription factor domain-containing protein n=1 Tax=Trichoderma asperellum (strain ATCC 204424 / CBS 433.97 / NBRC 101777) TaxID=1042311 RepID=A0A2T3ZB16_TRIA4|nr:hypothetical protein M441DRAFT_45720 [Trichoderma asperellum CBS 433.97]PTB41995.1 hypothetical protein M441DRAFT_45720 [Trichoderma asperellum CBS 433.97]UKZ94009.1 hypothetical protein TrAFT101_008904 [Trichoderma asperellum]
MAMVEHINNGDDDGLYNDGDLFLHPTIVSRPLTIMPSHSHPNRFSTAASAASAASAKTISAKPTTPAFKLQFINTAHPGESTTAKRISQIRSHVAKDSHARRRQRKAAQIRPGTFIAVTPSSSRRNNSITSYSSASSSLPYLAADDAARTDEPSSTSASPDGLQRPHQAWLSSTNTALGQKGFRRIAPKRGAMVRKAASPGPRQMIGDTMKDAWNGQFAWDLSLDDYGTFNYYLEWVLKYGYAVCFPPDQAPAVEKRMRSTFVPFAMSNPGLLTLILYVAYHRRAMNTTDVDEAIKCNRMVERYRMACIEWTRHAVSVEKRPTLETVAMALTMSSEAYFEDNFDTSLTHAQAARTMVSARGGLESFGKTGIDGLISFLLRTSVYCGNYIFVPGCARVPLPPE